MATERTGSADLVPLIHDALDDPEQEYLAAVAEAEAPARPATCDVEVPGQTMGELRCYLVAGHKFGHQATAIGDSEHTKTLYVWGDMGRLYAPREK